MRSTTVGILAVALFLSACSQSQPYIGETITQADVGAGVTVTEVESRSILPSGGLAGSEATLTEVTAQVTGLKMKTRELSLKSPDGISYKVTAGPEVRNFAQIKVGDTVRLAYLEAIDFQVRQPTTKELELAEQGMALAGRAPKGAKPAGLIAAGGTRIFTIGAVDKTNSLVTLTDTYNNLVTVKARYPQNLAKVKKGDTVVVTVAELVAADITPAS